ncbi:tRNA 2-thiouridine synthesizing protein E [Sinobacterium caligoides]|uniref:Sulfurtransferase n=1 Tax=Sinobacterium caligoides TaxID=933926 RepID=A0A3N2DJX7_9GAMM|nr:TusE/DsrC/DsvC family sulfur relay protein [Sinobacterium caligoides]ROS00077.1 tRNA 2-thiouridine synthesizing protein E [Sinobacterium caligoides]
MTSQATLKLDQHGFLLHLADWNETAAIQLASSEGITLTNAHWEVIYALRDFYNEYQLSPAMRPFVKYIKLKLGADKGNSIYLLQLFPESPAKLCSKIAGLPKPDNCL